MPCELSEHWDPAQPLLVGGLAPAEEGRGFMQLRLKRHRWFARVLKNRDPLTFSVGWRRFQSVPVYAVEDPNGRHRCAVRVLLLLHIDCAPWAAWQRQLQLHQLLAVVLLCWVSVDRGSPSDQGSDKQQR